MTIHRFAARRDANEPEIRKRFAHHGWHTEQVSGVGMPDLMCWCRGDMEMRRAFLVDVKDGTGKPTKAQVSKWTSLRAAGIPVYVVRTEADVDALVAGTLEPWTPDANTQTPRPPRSQRTPTAPDRAPRKGDAAKARARGKARLRAEADAIAERSEKRLVEKGYIGQAVVNYTPPRSKTADDSAEFKAEVRRRIGLKAAQEAEVFAPPPPCHVPGCVGVYPCPFHQLPNMGKR